ncbi:MAG: right-handed parallel beta-helix repeat-containing protein [Bacteroidota bacterium]
MQLKDHQETTKIIGQWLMRSLLLLTAGLFAFYVLIPTYLSWLTRKDRQVIHCDMERTWQGYYVSNGQWFSNGNRPSRDYAFSGQQSAFLDRGEYFQWGPSYQTKSLEPGAYKASVWRLISTKRKGRALLVVEQQGEGALKKETNEPVRKESNEWEQLEIYFELTPELAAKDLRIFVCSDGQGKVYFDDLRIERLSESQKASEANLAQIKLRLNEKAMNQIRAKRKSAFDAGLLITSSDDWVKGELQEGDEQVPVKMRLKGDWVDHLEGEQWSFRIKVKDPFAWKRMKVFSIQNPKTRYYIWEWLIHQLWEREDVLTTRYDFAQVKLNGQDKGLYAYEEHFEKQLVESRARREGPILKFSEEALWASRARNYGVFNSHREELGPLMAQVQHARIEAFKEDQLQANPQLKAQLEQGRKLMFQYQNGLTAPEEIFDLERMARYLAISDFMGAFHGLVWHNQRFYYNPIIGKLEPIGYDAFGSKPRKPLFLSLTSSRIHHPHNVHPWKRLYYDEAFATLYAQCLMRISSDAYLEDWLDDLGPAIDERMTWLKKSAPEFSFSRKKLWERARLARAAMMPYEDFSLISRWHQVDGKRMLNLRSIHDMPIRVLAFGFTLQQRDYPLEQAEILLPSPMQLDTLSKDFDLPKGIQYVFYQGIGIDSVFVAPLTDVRALEQQTPAQALFGNGQLKFKPYFRVEGKNIYFKKGKQRVPGDIIIPKGYRVYFGPGVHLDLVRGAGFISQSPVFMEGQIDEPVKIGSSDFSASGFTILQAHEPSRFRYVQFENLNCLNYDGWTLTGGVSCYESDVDMAHCQILNGQSEDALNTIRSHIKIEDLLIRKTLSDGLDADFCTGYIRNSRIEQTGNDGLDISGSQIELSGSHMENCGDKGISAGEESQLSIDNTQIIGTVIGVASKDFSKVRIESIRLEDCNQAFAAYQKKPEFGPSSIEVIDYQAEDINYLYTIGQNCRLDLKGQILYGE